MTAVELAVPLCREDVLHFLGYRGQGSPAPRVEEILGPVIEEARGLVHPRGLDKVVRPEDAGRLGLEPRPERDLAVGLVTIGFELERQVAGLLAQGHATRALLLDAAGSAAAEEAAEALERRIHGGRTARRFSPGYGCWPITAQRALFDLLPHEEIGVRLLDSCLMTPRKSVSFAVWLGEAEEAGVGQARGPGRCETCGLTSCAYRRGASGLEASARRDP